MMQQIDRAAQSLGRRQDRLVVADLDAQNIHQRANDRLDHGEQRSQQVHHQLHRARNQQRHPVRRIDGNGLRQHLGEDHDHHRHYAGGVEHADFTEPCGEDAGRQCGGTDIGDVVAEQQRADHPLAHGEQAGDDAGLAVALLRQPQHAGARRPGQRGFARREERGDQKRQAMTMEKCKPVHGAMPIIFGWSMIFSESRLPPCANAALGVRIML